MRNHAPSQFQATSNTSMIRHLLKDGDTWYEFGTANGPGRDGELPIRCSPDLHVWKRCGNVSTTFLTGSKRKPGDQRNCGRPTFRFSTANITSITRSRSSARTLLGIALLTNKTLDPHSSKFNWEDRGLVFRSKEEDNFNAIDPNLVARRKGRCMARFR